MASEIPDPIELMDARMDRLEAEHLDVPEGKTRCYGCKAVVDDGEGSTADARPDAPFCCWDCLGWHPEKVNGEWVMVPNTGKEIPMSSPDQAQERARAIEEMRRWIEDREYFANDPVSCAAALRRIEPNLPWLLDAAQERDRLKAERSHTWEALHKALSLLDGATPEDGWSALDECARGVVKTIRDAKTIMRAELKQLRAQAQADAERIRKLEHQNERLVAYLKTLDDKSDEAAQQDFVQWLRGENAERIRELEKAETLRISTTVTTLEQIIADLDSAEEWAKRTNVGHIHARLDQARFEARQQLEALRGATGEKRTIVSEVVLGDDPFEIRVTEEHDQGERSRGEPR